MDGAGRAPSGSACASCPSPEGDEDLQPRPPRLGAPATIAAAIRTESAQDTERLGELLGGAAFPGAVVLLEGPLGAGKTALARGIGRGLGVGGPVTSPTFTILTRHAGRLTFFHLDLYRVTSPPELRAVDLDEVFGAGGVAAVEWPRWLVDDLPDASLLVRIEVVDAEARGFRLETLDPRWAPAIEAVQMMIRGREGRST